MTHSEDLTLKALQDPKHLHDPKGAERVRGHGRSSDVRIESVALGARLVHVQLGSLPKRQLRAHSHIDKGIPTAAVRPCFGSMPLRASERCRLDRIRLSVLPARET